MCVRFFLTVRPAKAGLRHPAASQQPPQPPGSTLQPTGGTDEAVLDPGRLLCLARERLEAEDADGALGLTLAAMKVGGCEYPEIQNHAPL